MGSAAVVQASLLIVVFYWKDIVSDQGVGITYLVFLVLLCSGIYAHLRSKHYKPFKQWQLYVFPASTVLCLNPGLMFLGTVAAIVTLANLPVAAETAAPGKQDSGANVLLVIGGIAGLVVGFVATAKTMEGSGDSMGGAIPFFLLVGITFLIGIAGGWVAAAALRYRLRERSGLWVVLASIVVLLLCGVWYGVWSDLDRGMGRIRSGVAALDLRNCRSNMDTYYLDHDQYPAVLDEANCVQSKEVVMIAKKLEKKEYVIISYHTRGTREYMVRSGSAPVFSRGKDSTEEWVQM